MSYPDIRTWARENGLTVGERGRFSKEVLDAYAAANPGAPTKVTKVVRKEKVTSSDAPPATVTTASVPVTRPGAKGMWARFKDGIRFPV